MEFMWFYMNLWKLDFAWNLYKPMKPNKFVIMWHFIDLHEKTHPWKLTFLNLFLVNHGHLIFHKCLWKKCLQNYLPSFIVIHALHHRCTIFHMKTNPRTTSLKFYFLFSRFLWHNFFLTFHLFFCLKVWTMRVNH